MLRGSQVVISTGASEPNFNERACSVNTARARSMNTARARRVLAGVRGVAARSVGIALIAGACSGGADPAALSDLAPAVGECFSAPGADAGSGDSGTASSTGSTSSGTGDRDVFEVVDCAQAHEAEVVGRVELGVAEGEPVPDPERLRVMGVDACVPSFQEFVGVAYRDSRLTLQPIIPIPSGWEDGDRTVVCVVVQLGPVGVAPDGPVEDPSSLRTAPMETSGSVKGSGR